LMPATWGKTRAAGGGGVSEFMLMRKKHPERGFEEMQSNLFEKLGRRHCLEYLTKKIGTEKTTNEKSGKNSKTKPSGKTKFARLVPS